MDFSPGFLTPSSQFRVRPQRWLKLPPRKEGVCLARLALHSRVSHVDTNWKCLLREVLLGPQAFRTAICLTHLYLLQTIFRIPVLAPLAHFFPYYFYWMYLFYDAVLASVAQHSKHTYMYPLLLDSPPIRVTDRESSSPCCTAGSHQSSVLHTVSGVCTCQSQSPDLSFYPHPSLVPFQFLSILTISFSISSNHIFLTYF